MAKGALPEYMKERPHKDVFSDEKQALILREMKKFIYANLPAGTRLHLKRLFGSLAKGTFGKYKGIWKGREFSDVDILFVVDDDFRVPRKWKVHFVAKKRDWVVYNVAVVPIEAFGETVLVDVQYIVIRKTFASLEENIVRAEKWGIPLRRKLSKNKYLSL